MSKEKGKREQSTQRHWRKKAYGRSLQDIVWSGLARPSLGMAGNQRGHDDEWDSTEFRLYFEDAGKRGKGSYRKEKGRSGRGRSFLCSGTSSPPVAVGDRCKGSRSNKQRPARKQR